MDTVTKDYVDSVATGMCFIVSELNPGPGIMKVRDVPPGDLFKTDEKDKLYKMGPFVSQYGNQPDDHGFRVAEQIRGDGTMYCLNCGNYVERYELVPDKDFDLIPYIS